MQLCSLDGLLDMLVLLPCPQHSPELGVCWDGLKSSIVTFLPSLARNSLLNIRAKDAPQSPFLLDDPTKSFRHPVKKVKC